MVEPYAAHAQGRIASAVLVAVRDKARTTAAWSDAFTHPGRSEHINWPGPSIEVGWSRHGIAPGGSPDARQLRLPPGEVGRISAIGYFMERAIRGIFGEQVVVVFVQGACGACRLTISARTCGRRDSRMLVCRYKTWEPSGKTMFSMARGSLAVDFRSRVALPLVSVVRARGQDDGTDQTGTAEHRWIFSKETLRSFDQREPVAVRSGDQVGPPCSCQSGGVLRGIRTRIKAKSRSISRSPSFQWLRRVCPPRRRCRPRAAATDAADVLLKPGPDAGRQSPRRGELTTNSHARFRSRRSQTCGTVELRRRAGGGGNFTLLPLLPTSFVLPLVLPRGLSYLIRIPKSMRLQLSFFARNMPWPKPARETFGTVRTPPRPVVPNAKVASFTAATRYTSQTNGKFLHLPRHAGRAYQISVELPGWRHGGGLPRRRPAGRRRNRAQAVPPRPA